MFFRALVSRSSHPRLRASPQAGDLDLPGDARAGPVLPVQRPADGGGGALEELLREPEHGPSAAAAAPGRLRTGRGALLLPLQLRVRGARQPQQQGQPARRDHQGL